MKKILSFVKDFILGAIGLIVLNAAMSLLVMPTIERTLGAEFQGRVLYYTSLASYLASIGFGLDFLLWRHIARCSCWLFQYSMTVCIRQSEVNQLDVLAIAGD